MVYYAVMNTLVASWGGQLRARIGRLAQRVSDWSVAKQQREEDMELKPEAQWELLAMMEDTNDESPAFETKEEMDAYLDEAVRKYREGKEEAVNGALYLSGE